MKLFTSQEKKTLSHRIKNKANEEIDRVIAETTITFA